MLGKGKYGMVYEARNRETGEKVAVKVIIKTNVQDEELEMQRAEINVLRISQHPNVIKLINIYENIDTLDLVFEFMAGGDLFDYQEARGFVLSDQVASRVINQLCAAIYFLHQHGIAHRDLKPENMLMSSNGDNAIMKLSDFGLAKVLGPGEFATEAFGTLVQLAETRYLFFRAMWLLMSLEGNITERRSTCGQSV